MTLMDTAQLLGNFGEFFGAIAVVATLVFLIVQIRQNTRQLRRVELNAASSQFSIPRMAIASDRGMAELAIKTLQAPDEIDAVDQLRIDMLLIELMNAYFHAWDRARTGSFDKEIWEKATIPGLVSQFTTGEVAPRWWTDNRLGFIPAFREDIDRIEFLGGSANSERLEA